MYGKNMRSVNYRLALDLQRFRIWPFVRVEKVCFLILKPCYKLYGTFLNLIADFYVCFEQSSSVCVLLDQGDRPNEGKIS